MLSNLNKTILSLILSIFLGLAFSSANSFAKEKKPCRYQYYKPGFGIKRVWGYSIRDYNRRGRRHRAWERRSFRAYPPYYKYRRYRRHRYYDRKGYLRGYRKGYQRGYRDGFRDGVKTRYYNRYLGGLY